MAGMNETHDPARRSWVEAANRPGCDFPIQNLPFAVFQSPGRPPRGGVAIGDMIFDLKAAVNAGLFSQSARETAQAACRPTLNELMALPPQQLSVLRYELSDLLRSDAPARQRIERLASDLLFPMQDATYLVPAAIGGFTDFFTSVHHVTRAGRLLRPDSPLPPAFKSLPLAYHGRASSIAVSDTPVIRPRGQYKHDGEVKFAPTRTLDFELELGIYIGTGNAPGRPIPLSAAAEHIFGFCLLNDWSARDIQRWESFPLGPFLGKSFCTTISPWIVTSEALTPFRVAAPERDKDDPALLAYLHDPTDQTQGGFDIELIATLETAEMRSKGEAPARITRTHLSALYWTCAQMIAHHTSNGCNLQPGDLLATGTTSGPADENRACMLELTAGGKQPLKLPNGGTRAWLEDGDTLAFHGRATRGGFVSIGFGECRARIEPALHE
jgi:fumarylacetoacetase